MKKQIITLLIALIMPIYLFSQINIVKIKFNEGYYSAPYHNAKLSFNAYIKNTDSIQHTNLQLNVKNLQTNQVFTSPVKAFLAANDSSFLTIDSIAVNYNTFNSYKFWVKFDINSTVYFSDTLKIGGTNLNQPYLAIDNNIYTETNFINPFDISGSGMLANRFIFKDFAPCPAGIAVAIGKGTTVGSIIKAILLKKQDDYFTILTESDYYTLLPNEINNDSSLNPVLLNLPFNFTVNCFHKDTAYYAGIQYFGGGDTTLIAEDKSSFQHADSSIWGSNYSNNTWQPIANKKNAPIIKLYFSYGLGCNYGNSLNLSTNYIVLSGNQGATHLVNINSCINISNIVCKPWLSCYVSSGYLVIQSLSANQTGSPRIDTVRIYSYSGNVTLIVEQLADVSVNEIEEQNFNIYPNPTNNKLNIETKSQIKLKSVSIISAIGEELIRLESEIADKKEIEIDLSNLSSGIYFIKIQCDEKSIFKKLIKK
jgi:hypothetical protein